MSEVEHLYLSPVRAERADDFEAFLRDVIVPAVARHAPQAVQRWRALRSDSAQDGVVTFAFLFSGGEAQDWELEPVLTAALGAAEAERALASFVEMMSGDQYGWSMRPVALG